MGIELYSNIKDFQEGEKRVGKKGRTFYKWNGSSGIKSDPKFIKSRQNVSDGINTRPTKLKRKPDHSLPTQRKQLCLESVVSKLWPFFRRSDKDSCDFTEGENTKEFKRNQNYNLFDAQPGIKKDSNIKVPRVVSWIKARPGKRKDYESHEAEKHEIDELIKEVKQDYEHTDSKELSDKSWSEKLQKNRANKVIKATLQGTPMMNDRNTMAESHEIREPEQGSPNGLQSISFKQEVTLSPKRLYDESYVAIDRSENSSTNSIEIEHNSGKNEKLALRLSVVGVQSVLDQGHVEDRDSEKQKKFVGNKEHEDTDQFHHVVKQISSSQTEHIKSETSIQVLTLNDVIDRLSRGERVNPKESMKYETLRLCTFRTYPSQGKPSAMKFAGAGFYYASNADEVICYVCAKRISNWRENDDPMAAHKRITPECKFHTNNSEVNIKTETGQSELYARISSVVENLSTAGRTNTGTGASNARDETQDVGPLPTPAKEEHDNITVVSDNMRKENDGSVKHDGKSAKTSNDLEKDCELSVNQRGSDHRMNGAFAFVDTPKQPSSLPWSSSEVKEPAKFESLPQWTNESNQRPDVGNRNIANMKTPAVAVVVKKVENQTGVMVSSLVDIPEVDTTPSQPTDDDQPQAENMQGADHGRDPTNTQSSNVSHDNQSSGSSESVKNNSSQYHNSSTAETERQTSTPNSRRIRRGPGEDRNNGMFGSQNQSSLAAQTNSATSETSHAVPLEVRKFLPKYARYATVTARESSFNTCPEIHVSPHVLAEAGFFYAGTADCSRCFHCGIGLRHWSREDDPWTEHARFSLECQYVIAHKGMEFINLVKLALDLTEESSEDTDRQMPGNQDETSSSTATTTTTTTEETAQNTTVEPNRSTDVLSTGAAQSVLQMGYRLAGLTGENIMEEVFAIEEGTSESTEIPIESATNTSSTTTDTRSSSTPASEDRNSVSPMTSLPPSAHMGHSAPIQGNLLSLPVTRHAISEEVPSTKEAESDGSRIDHRRRLVMENKNMKKDNLCSKCKQRDICIVFLPCGHLITCEACGNTLRQCFSCGARVRGTVRTYRA
ncbi:DIAP2-like protein [Mya arenaria]|uniref:DIAP2-like protein n=1 Tax=Mya arenaria TaxID=6604 RepID=A0ABY7G5A9_MYAAR|nr:DIAP2-like protein [Mya arenaria]